MAQAQASTIDRALEAAEGLKAAGNALFQSGRIDDAVAQYQAALQQLCLVEPTGANGPAAASMADPATATSPTSAVAAAKAIVLSNVAHALCEGGRFAASADAARSAVAANPSLLKGWLRLARALYKCGRPFEAFVILHLQVPALVSAARMAVRDAHALCGGLIEEVCASVGVSGLSPAFGLRATPGGGVCTVAREAAAADKVLFTESQWSHPRLSADVGSESPAVVSNDTLIAFFAKQLHRLQQSEDAKDGDSASETAADSDWRHIKGMLAGSWPRHLEDIPTAQRALTEAIVVTTCNPNNGTGLQQQPERVAELVHLSLICRYNCFHSGFFRACALLNHSCAPNAAMKYDPRQQAVRMLVVSPVRPGDTLTVKYLSDADFLEGVGRRRELLHNSWLFWCECNRCVRDNAPDAQCEMRVCTAGCGAYVHCPVPGMERVHGGTSSSSSSVSEEDPITVRERGCASCGARCSWTDADTKRIYDARIEATQLVQGMMQDLSTKLMALQARVNDMVHPEHWIHRVLYYYFGVSATRIVAQWFQALAQQQLSMGDIAVAALRQFGLGQGGRNGGDVLVCLRDLWRRMVDFYPWNEGWALHCGIVRLAIMNLCAPEHPASMEPDDVLAVLSMHAPYIGSQERNVCLRVFQAHRSTTDKATGATLLKRIRKVLSE